MRRLSSIIDILLVAGSLLVVPASHAHEEHGRAGMADARPGIAVSVAFDAQGRLWRARVENGRVLVDHSDDLKTFSPAVAANAEPEKIGAEGELRPKLAIGRRGELYLSWTQALPQPFAGNIKFSRSLDGGRTFSTPIVVNRDRQPITHRFATLVLAPNGTIFIAWIDKRDLQAAKAANRPYDGAAIYYAVSRDGGASFETEYKLADHTCECCRIGIATASDGSALAFWRHVYDGGVRDHAVATLGARGVLKGPQRVSYDNWKIDACPHHGPAIVRGGDWGWHMAWYDGAEGKQGLRYARLDGEAWVTSPPRRFGNPDAQAGHPALLADDERVFLAWKELDEDGAYIMIMTSTDGGRHWDKARRIAQSAGATDYPMLVARGQQVFLSWNTARDGYRLVPLEAP